MEIRNMLPEDIDQVVEIENESFSRPWSKRSFEESLEKSDYIFIVADNRGVIVGYCGLYVVMDEANITNVAVKEEYRNKGVGYVIIEDLIERAKNAGVKAMTLEVRKSNNAAIRLYEQVGFKNAGIRRNFYESPKEDAVIMWKEHL